jgi:hypothetical protein
MSEQTSPSPIIVHEDYTLEIKGVCIEYLKREDLAQIQSAISRVLVEKDSLIYASKAPPNSNYPSKQSEAKWSTKITDNTSDA